MNLAPSFLALLLIIFVKVTFPLDKVDEIVDEENGVRPAPVAAHLAQVLTAKGEDVQAAALEVAHEKLLLH